MMSKIPWEKIQRRTSSKKFYLKCDCKLSSTDERQKLCKTNFVKSQSHYFSHKKSMYREWVLFNSLRREKKNKIITELPWIWKGTLRKVKAQNVKQPARNMQGKQRKRSVSTLVARGRQRKKLIHYSTGKKLSSHGTNKKPKCLMDLLLQSSLKRLDAIRQIM